MELDLEQSNQQIKPTLTDEELENMNVVLSQTKDWDNMICDSCQ